MVRAFASLQYGPGLRVISRLSLLLVLVLAPRGFSPGTPVIPSPHKPTFPHSTSISITLHQAKHFIMTSGLGDYASVPRVIGIK